MLADQGQLLAVGEELAGALALEQEPPLPIHLPPLWEHGWDQPHGFWQRVWTCRADVASLIERGRIDVEAVRRLYEALVLVCSQWRATDVTAFVGDGKDDRAAAIARWYSAIADRFGRAVGELRELVATSVNALSLDGGPRRGKTR